MERRGLRREEIFKTLKKYSTRGKSLCEKVYEIYTKTIGFLCDFCRNNRIFLKSVRDFLIVIYPSLTSA